MRKTGILIGLLAVLLIVSLAFASWKGTGLRLGITTSGDTTTITQNLSVDGAVSTSGVTVTAQGPTDDLDVQSANVVKIDTSSNAVTIGGFVNGADGQTLHVAVVDNTNSTTLENSENATTQKIYLSTASDETISTGYGGWTLVCNGTAWFEVDQ